MIQLKKEMMKTDFGRGFITLLVKAVHHYEDFRRYENLDTREESIRGWFEGPKQHLVSLELPKIFRGTEIAVLARWLVDFVSELDYKGNASEDDVNRACWVAELIARSVDRHLGVAEFTLPLIEVGKFLGCILNIKGEEKRRKAAREWPIDLWKRLHKLEFPGVIIARRNEIAELLQRLKSFCDDLAENSTDNARTGEARKALFAVAAMIDKETGLEPDIGKYS